MKQTITIKVDYSGDMEVHQEGFVGDACNAVNKAFETIGVIEKKTDMSLPDGWQKLPAYVKGN